MPGPELYPIKENILPQETLLPQDRTIPRPYTDLGGPVMGGGEKSIFPPGPANEDIAKTVTTGELYNARRYAMYDPTKTEDDYAWGQSNWDKAANGILKGVNLAGTTILGGFGVLGGALASAAVTHKLSTIWDNPILRGLDEWNNEVDNNILPNYYTDAEKNAAWYSPTNWFKTNFLFDKLVKNSGFAVGAMLSGNLADAALIRSGALVGRLAMAGAEAAEASRAFETFSPLLKNMARAFSKGKNIEVANALEKEISSIADVTARTSEIAKIAQSTNKFANFGDVGRRWAIATYSSAGESSFEALQTGNQLRNNLIADWKEKHGGEEPVGADLQKINDYAESVGKASFFGNMALLTITEHAQLPKLIGSSYAAEKQAANSLVGKVDDVLLKEGKYVAAPGATTKFGKLMSKAGGISKYVFDPKEASQEGLQYALQVGTQNYFNKAYQSKAADAVTDGFLYGLIGVNEKGEGVGAINSKEGMESIALGGVTGGLMQIKGNIVEGRAIKSNTEQFIDKLNSVPQFQEAFKQRLAAANRGVVLQEQQQDAVMNGDQLEARDINADMMHNYLAPRIKYGRFDMVMDDISELKQKGSTEQGLSDLKQEGLANINDTVQSYQKRLTKFESVAKNTKEIYKSTNFRYSGEILKDENGEAILDADGKQQRKYSDLVIDKMVYATSKIADYDLRIPSVNLSLAESGINTQDILQSIIKENKPNKEATAQALNQINDLDVTSDVKDALKEKLSDVIELSLRRKMFIGEYDDIKSNPLRYELVQDVAFGETREVPVTVAQKNEEKPEKKLEIGKEYSLAEPFRKEGSQLQLAPKITVLSQTLGGELEVKLPNGKTSFMTPEEFKKYTISDENNTSQEMADVLDKAIDTVLKDDKYADIRKELSEASKNLGDKKIDKVGWINSLDNQSLVNDVAKEFDAQTKEIFETRERLKREAEQLKKNKEEINKQQNEIVKDSGDVGTNNPTSDKVVPEGKLLDAKIMFISGTSESEKEGYYIDDNGEVLDPKQAELHVRNSREFLNNVGGFENRSNMRTILVTPALAKAYGLDGLVQMSYGKDLDSDVNEIPNVNDVNLGFIGQVFVEQVGDKLFFLDKTGKQLGELGKQLDREALQNVIFQTMRTTKLTYNDNTTPRYRKDQKEEAEAYAEAWKKDRARIFNTSPDASPTVYEFQVSRGIAEKGDVNNHVAGTLINKDNEARILATDQTLIQIPTAGVVAHHTGQINMPNGRPVLVHQDNVEFLNNIQFKGKKAQAIYEVINQMATEINEQAKAGKRIIINKKLSRFLQNVLYWRLGTTEPGSNQINIAEDGSSISFSGKTYAIPEIATRKSELLEDIEKAFHNVNNKTLSPEMFSKPFTEYYMKDGELVSNDWTNYQTYLLSSTYPDGSARSVEDTPLSTKIAKPTADIPYTHKQKYATLIGLELPVGVIAKPAKATTVTEAPVTKTERKYDYDGETDNIFTTPFGDVIFTVKEGEAPKFDETDETFKSTRDKIIKKLNDNRIKKGESALSEEELIPQANGVIVALVNKELETDVVTPETSKAEEKKEETPTAPVSDIEAKKAAIEKERQEDLELLNKAIYDSNKWEFPGPTVEKINAKYDAELAALEGKPTGEPKEPGSFDVKNVKKRGNLGFRKVGVLDKTDRMSDADFKAFKEWHAQNVPAIPFEVLENMININSTEKAWGVFENGVAKFVKGGLRGTEYHEVGEAIWNGMLTKEEQQALIEEFRKKAGKFTDRETNKKYNYDDPKVSDQMVKERILDDFADFRLGKLPARSIGEAITKFFRRILEFFKSFVSKPSLKEKLFKDIESGEFKDRQLSAESKSMPPQYRAAGQLTEEQTNAFVKDMTALSAAIMFGNGEIGTIDKSAIYNLRTLTSDAVFKKIEEIYTEQEIKQELGESTWKELVKKTKQELKTLLKVDFNDEDLININEGETNKNDYAREPFSTDWKKNAPMGIKFASATLLDRVPTNQENSTSFKLPDAKVNPKTETYSLVPFTRVFTTMLDKLKNTTSIGKVVSKIINLANQDANYVSMFQRLGGNLENKTIDFSKFKMEDWRLFIEMMQTYTKQKPNAVIQYISQGQVYSGSAMVSGIVNVTTRGWIQNMRNLAKEADSVIKYDSVDKVYSISDLSGIPTDTPQQKVSFLAELGISFPLEAFNKLKKEQQKEFTLTVAKLKEYLQEAKEIMSVKKKTLDVAGQYDTLATLLVGVTHPNMETTRVNLDGKQSNSFADNNAPSVFENEFNEVKTLDELLKLRPELQDVYSKGSQLLKKGGQFFDKQGNRTSLELKLGYIEGTKNKDDNKGTTSVKLSLGARYTQELNQNLLGQYYVLIPADGSTEWMMNLGNHVSFEDVEQGKEGWKQINKIFRGYLTDDIALALDADNRKQLRNVGSKAKELRFFKDILSGKVLSTVNEMIAEGKTQDDIEKYIDDNIDAVNQSIKDYIDGTVAETKNILLQNDQIKFVNRDEETGLDYYSYKMLNDNFSKNENLNKNKLTQDDIANLLTFANANYIINNIEFHKVIFGDPYQFEVKKNGSLDETKRIKSFLSPRRTTFDSPELNTFLNEEFNKAGDVELQPGEPGYHEHKAWIDTVTVSDVTVMGSVTNMKNVPEDVRKAFAKTNEGDASSIVMDGTYRELKMKNRQWDDKAEAWHQWQMAFTRQNLPEFKYSNDARGKALEAHDKALLKKKEPKHVIEVIKPIVSGVTNNSGNINLVLDKFSQMPLYYSMVKGTNLEKLYTKMMNEKKGYIIMISGRKVGAEALHDLYTPKGEFNDSAFNNNIEVPWKAYGIQVETTYESSGEQTRGSQLTKISTLDLYENGEAIGKTPERREEIAKEVKRNKEILDKLHKNGYERFLKRLGIEDLGGSYKITNKRALAKTLQDEMFRRELSDNVKDSIQLDQNGEFIIPFEASPAYLQIKSILYSFVDKEITSPKMHGGSYVQAPVTLWENAKEGRKIAIKTKDGYKQITRQEYDSYTPEEQKKVVLTDDTLKFYEDEDGKRHCEVMLPHWFKSRLGKHANKSDKELLNFLNSTKEGQELLSGIGFRIPTQSLSSVEVFKVKGFLPQYMGKTVIVPSEITTKAGSDFDIDKMNMYLKAVYVDKYGEIKIARLKGTEEATRDFYANVFDEKLENKKITKAELFDAANILIEGLDDPNNLVDKYSDILDNIFEEAYTLEERRDIVEDLNKKLQGLGDKDAQAILKEKFVADTYRRSLENEYYNSLENLLTLPENFQRLISPVSDDGLKEISEKLDKLRGYDENTIKNRILNRNFMTSLRHAFVTAKRWVGIAAVNITGHSLTQKFKAYIDPARFNNVPLADRKILKYGNGEVLLDHNKLEKDGQSYISLSGRLDADGKFISDGLSGFATSFVDVAKDPYILKIIKSDLAVGTFMFLRRIGVPKEQLAMFMNQPIIDEYLTMLDNKGVRTLFDSRYITAIQNKFPSTITQKDLDGFNKAELADNIENYYATKVNDQGVIYTKNLGDYKNHEQNNILQEFLKYAKMAEYSFKLTQASNYDTTKFQSGDSLQLKQWRTEAAKNSNIISSVGELLENNFIGTQAKYLDKSMDAMGEALVLESPEFTDVTNEVLKSYEQDMFLSKDKFDRIANKIKASFLDYIIQKRSDVADNIQKQLADDKESVAQMLTKAKKDFPGVQILEDLEVDSSGRVGGAQTIKLKVNDKIAYTENMYQGMMRELRDNPSTNALYKGIVRLSILQGTYQSPISIKNIVPVEDYSSYITPIMAGLKVDDEIRAFASTYEFQRNEWQDNDVVPIIEPRFAEEFRQESEYDLPRKFQGLFKMVGLGDKKKRVPGPFPTIKEIGVNTNKRDLMFVNSKYNAKVSNYDVIKMPRAVSIDKKNAEEGKIDVATGLEITNQTYAEKIKKGDTSLQNFYGYQKVKYADGSPLVAYYDQEGNPVYVYKFINLHGDGQYAAEYYGDGRPSVFSNGSQKNVKNVEGTLVSNEIPDQVIIDYYGGEIVPEDQADIITATIEKETENVVPSQPVQQAQSIEPKGQKVKEGIYVNQAALTKDEQLELFDYLKPFLEEQASKTNKGVSASKMIGLGLRWDYKSNNSGKQAMSIPDVISEGNKNKYGYYNTSINNQPLGQITPRFKELMEKATGVDMTNYDGAIINLYDNESFISAHNDVDESRSAIKYPVIGINLGGTGNFSIESRDGSPKQLNLKAGTGYVFGVNGTNRAVFHRTFPGKQDSFLPELTTKLDGKTYEPGSYRVTITMRRVMPLEEGMPTSPVIKSQSTQPAETVSPEVKVEKDVQDIIYKSNLDASEYEVVEINGKQRVIDKRDVPERVKKGFSKFYSTAVGTFIERYGKKIIVPGFEDMNLMMEQDTNDVYELSTGLRVPTMSNTQKAIKEELERIFKEKNIRKILADSKKTDINNTLLIKIAPEGLPPIDNTNQNNCGG